MFGFDRGGYRGFWCRLAIGALALAGSAAASPPSAPPPVDYADPARWICRPGVDDGTCSHGLDAAVVARDGSLSRLPYVPARAPSIDCFYVYPTSSNDAAMLSDLVPDEERKLVHDQLARFGSRCRLFAPVYHQLTIAALKDAMARSGDPTRITLDLTIPYRDILAAWRYYLAHDNQGRGVVLIGHSQGALLLARLIAQEVEGHPAQRQLVAAYLAGSLTMDSGTFRNLRPCRAADQTGCFVAWSSYAADYDGPRLFGRANAPASPVCVNPAALGGGSATAKAYLRASTSTPPEPAYLYVENGIKAECVTDAAGAALRIHLLPEPDADAIAKALPISRAGVSWNLHPHDIDLVQGNLLDLMASESAAWARGHPSQEQRP